MILVHVNFVKLGNDNFFKRRVYLTDWFGDYLIIDQLISVNDLSLIG